MSTPTEILSGCAYMNEPNDASVSASTQEAPPCHSPYGWVLPATGIRPITRSGLIDHSVSDLTERYLIHDNDNGREYYISFIQSVMEQGITGIVAENDLIAIEIMQIAKELGLSIPDDFSIVGFDNIHLSSFVEPKLTTISQDFEQMGYQAAQNLVAIMENPQKQPRENVVVPVELIERQTVKRL